MTELRKQGLTRRALLSRAAAAGALAVAGAGFIAAPDAAWAVEVTAIVTMWPKFIGMLFKLAMNKHAIAS